MAELQMVNLKLVFSIPHEMLPWQPNFAGFSVWVLLDAGD